MMINEESVSVSRAEVPWELLHRLIPNQGLMDIRPECGLLCDGRAFATMHRSRDTYYLFNNKYEYIYHFLAHYVNNMRKSRYIKARDFIKSLHSIVRFPRMEAVSATVEDVQTIASLIPNVEVINNPPTLALQIKGP